MKKLKIKINHKDNRGIISDILENEKCIQPAGFCPEGQLYRERLNQVPDTWCIS